MPLDRVQPLKLEDTATGGAEIDAFPTAADRNEDYLDCRGLTLQSDVSNDEAVRVERVGDNLQFVDVNNTTPKTLSEILQASGITEADHKALRQLIHFIDDGPAEGFASGAYKEITPAADPFPTKETWWSSTGKVAKLIELTITRDSSKKPTTEVWKVYSAAGVVLATITDTISYSGVFETSRTRSIV